MKKFKRFLACFLVVVFSLISFLGCSANNTLKRLSKKLTTYSIDAVFCDEEKKVTAVEKIDYINNTETILDSVCFNLYGKAFSESATVKPYAKNKAEACFPNGINYGDLEIKTVSVENSIVEIKFVGVDNNALEVSLLEPLYAGDRVTIVIEFVLYLANCTHRLGYMDGKINLGNWYPIASIYENGEFNIEPYYSNGDPFYSECANYNVSICYPDNYTLFASGEEKENSIGGQTKKTTLKAVVVRDFALMLANNVNFKTAKVGKTTIKMVANALDENIDTYLSTAVKTVELFNKKFGEYPYPTLTVVFTDFFQGGMEYPNFVTVSTQVTELAEIKKVIVHEIAHQWWYGIVGNNEIIDAWFDEGLAEYSTMLYFENYKDEGVDSEKLIKDTVISYELYMDVMKSLNVKINEAMNLPLNEYQSEYEYVYMVYVKGLLFFNALRTNLGDEMFFKSLKNIFNEYKFKIINKQKFVASIENTTKLNLAEFVEGWLNGTVDISQN